MKKNKKYKRFCCWCGKIEYTQFCESESLDKVVDEAVAYMKKDFKQFKSKRK